MIIHIRYACKPHVWVNLSRKKFTSKRFTFSFRRGLLAWEFDRLFCNCLIAGLSPPVPVTQQNEPLPASGMMHLTRLIKIIAIIITVMTALVKNCLYNYRTTCLCKVYTIYLCFFEENAKMQCPDVLNNLDITGYDGNYVATNICISSPVKTTGDQTSLSLSNQQLTTNDTYLMDLKNTPQNT